MRFEDLMLDRAGTVAEEAAILKTNKLIELRRSNYKDILNRLGSEENSVENLVKLDKEKHSFEDVIKSEREEHRLEHVTWYGGVNFINDSKSRTTNATYYSLETVNKNLVWIAGGDTQNVNYSELIGHVSKRVKTIVCIGKDNRKLIETFSGIVPIKEAEDMESAVRTAYYEAVKAEYADETGKTVILSPACECDELYQDYQTRGTEFKRAIAQL